MPRSVALVTGGSRGLGRAIALRLANDGYDVGIAYLDRSADADDVTREIKKLGRDAVAVAVDVAITSQVDKFVADAMKRWQRIDVLICNAGIFSRSLITETSDEEFERTFAVNVGGVFKMIRAVLPVMVAQGSGRIVTISSHNAKRGTGPSSRATYAATKNAVESYTKGAAVEAAPHGITVNCVSPGWIEKEAPPPERTELQKKLLEGIPLGRPGDPGDIAGAVAYLVSPDAKYVTGETLDVNGGTWMD